MRSDDYQQYYTAENLMGPNSIRLLDELLRTYPLAFTPDQTVLDLGCGTGLTSMFIAQETGATVYANDLWISEEDNRRRFIQWGLEHQLIPVHEDANDLHFEKEKFDAVISIDSYHYFGGYEGFFAGHILPWIKPGGIALIAVPGMKNAYHGECDELVSQWLGNEAYMFKSADRWRQLIGCHEDMEIVRTWELASFEQPWQEWFNTGHEYALNDQRYYHSLLKPRTAFVGMMVRKKK